MRQVLCLSVFIFSCSGIGLAQSDFLTLQKRIQELFEQYKGAVVRVEALHTEPAQIDSDQPIATVKYSTGFFISREGLILASAGRVKGSKRLTVVHQGTQYLAELIAIDEQTKIALLKAVYLPDQFDFLRMNESPALPEPGTLTLAITCPLTFSPSPKMALITGQDTKFEYKLFPTTLLRVDSPANKGEIGSPIIDLQGRLVGMFFATLPEIQSSFVMPAGAINKIKDDLLLEGRASYASVGIEVGQHFIRGGRSRVKILDVIEESPAAKAGIAKGDIVLKVGDYTINDFSDFPNAMFFIRVGEYVDIEIERDSQQIAFNLPTIRRPDEERRIKIRAITADEAKDQGEPKAQVQPNPDPVEVRLDHLNPLKIPLSPQKETEGPVPQS